MLPTSRSGPSPSTIGTRGRGERHPELSVCGDNHNAACEDKSQAGANMRLRFNPELHISDNLRVLSQIDLLDNLVLGSTPGGFPPGSRSTARTSRVPTEPLCPHRRIRFDQRPPTVGDQQHPKQHHRQARVGRVRHARRATRVRSHAPPLGSRHPREQRRHLRLRLAVDDATASCSRRDSRASISTSSGTWDFPNEGATSATLESLVGGQPYDLAQLDDVNQYTSMARSSKRDPELAKLDLARGNVVVNGGVYFAYRDQYARHRVVRQARHRTRQVHATTETSPYFRRGHQPTIPLTSGSSSSTANSGSSSKG